MLFFVAVVTAGPLFVPPLAQLVGAIPARIFGVPGRLAGQNARRNPARTAATTIALTLGLALITLVSTVVTTTKTSVTRYIDQHFAVDFVVAAVATDGTVPAGAVRELQSQPAIGGVAALRKADGTVGGRSEKVWGGEPAELMKVAPNVVASGSLNDLRPGTIALDTDVAKKLHVTVGQKVDNQGQRKQVVALLSPETIGPAMIPMTDFTAAHPGVGVDSVAVKKGTTGPATQAAIDSVITDYPSIESQSLR